MKPERIKELIALAQQEIEFRLTPILSDSEHDLRTLTIIFDFSKGSTVGVVSRVEVKRILNATG